MPFKQNEKALARTSNDGDGDGLDCAYYSTFDGAYYEKKIRDTNQATRCANYDEY